MFTNADGALKEDRRNRLAQKYRICSRNNLPLPRSELWLADMAPFSSGNLLTAALHFWSTSRIRAWFFSPDLAQDVPAAQGTQKGTYAAAWPGRAMAEHSASKTRWLVASPLPSAHLQVFPPSLLRLPWSCMCKSTALSLVYGWVSV